MFPDRQPRAPRPCVVALAVLGCLPTLLPTLLSASTAGRPADRLSAVEIRLDEEPGRPFDLESALAFAPGELITDDNVRRTMSNFYATGLFDEVEVRRRREDTGTVAVVVLRTHTWVDSVEIRGETGLRRDLLSRRIEQRAGEPLVEDRLMASVYALQDLYEEHGYLRASVDLRVVPGAGEKRRTVIFEVDSGPRATLGQVGFEGDLSPLEPADLLAAMSLEPGAPFDRQRMLDQVERLRGALVRRGYLQASVRPPREAYDETAHRMQLTYPIEVGPKISVRVLGADQDFLQRRGLLPFLDDQVYDEALLRQTVDGIRAFYQRRGHYEVEVRTDVDSAEDHVNLVIWVEPGPVYELREIRFTGNRHISDKELRQLMSTAPAKALSGGRLVEEVLRDDLSNLHSFYALQGFPDVEVGPVRVDILAETLELTVPIREGARRRVVHLLLNGVASLDAAEIRRKLPLKRGGPFHPVLLDESVTVIRALYEEQGYADVLVSPQLDWNEEHTLVDVDLEIREGRRSVVDRVILRGHHLTRPEVLHRFAGIGEGEPISRRRLLEAERRLYQLGIFSRVDVDVGPLSDPSGRRDVVIRLEEGRRWRAAYGLSYHSDDGPGGLLSLSRVNIGGRADRLQLDVRVNERDRRFRLIFDQPSLPRFKIPITYSLFRQDEERESFTVQDTGVQVTLTKDLPRLRLGLTYDYRLVKLLETELDPQIDREDRERQISSLTPNIYVDRRDDPLDPSRGFLSSIRVEYAFPFIEATADFAKLFVQHAAYAPLGRAGVLAASLRLGAIEPLDLGAERDPLVPADLASGLIPVSERFFAGGRTTHRAYERDKLGVPGQTLLAVGGDVLEEGELFEAGGNGLFLLNVDYRFPIAGAFGGTVFFDLGNVWSDWRNFEPDEMKPGVGLGFRYRSPIGPVRLEVGWKLDPEPGEDRSPVFFISLGNPF